MTPTASLRAHQPSPLPPPRPRHPGFDPELADVHVVPPMVYVEPVFEYKELTRDLAAGAAPPTEAELNELGRAGWELVSVLHDGRTARFYFKRATR
jgi:hypothetical protein